MYFQMKFTLFEGGVHTPALIWSPMILNRSRIHADYLHITDWLPTFYNLAGGDIANLGPIDGVDQWESISKGTRGPRNTLLLNIDENERSSGAIKGRFKYLTGKIVHKRFSLKVADNLRLLTTYDFHNLQ